MEPKKAIMEGTLNRKYKKFFSSWKARYYELKPPFLEYRKWKGLPMRGIFNLLNAKVYGHSKKELIFKVKLKNKKSLTFKAVSKEEVTKWMKLIEDVVKPSQKFLRS